MKVAEVPNTWILEEGLRLDPRPYVGGAMRLRKRVLELPHSKLEAVTTGFRGGIFTHLFSPKRTYVSDRKYGVPFLGASSMLLADLSDLPLLSNRDAESRSYKPLKVQPGMTLISCSGSVGRMTYTRRSMDGMASAGDLLKIQPDPDKIPPGYLYAFLRSEVGAALVGGGTYGSIVQHLERQHVANIPVPRLGKRIECAAHDLIDEAARLRDEASDLFSKSDSLFIELLSLPTPKPQSDYIARQISKGTSAQFVKRADAYYYAPLNLDARRAFDSAKPTTTVGEVAEVFIPGIFKRQYATDPSYGVPYITGADVFRLVPTTDQYLLKHIAKDVGLVLRKGMIVIQEAGQLGGLIGRSALVGDVLDGYACSNNMVRVTAKDAADTGYLYAVLASTYGMRLISREAAGSSIPHIEAGRVRALSIPWPERSVRERVGKLVIDAQRGRDDALKAERKALRIVEQAVENGATN
jgi:type I restriction enzyme, S subunit